MTKLQFEALSNAEAFLNHLRDLLAADLAKAMKSKTAGKTTIMALSVELGALEAALAALEKVG